MLNGKLQIAKADNGWSLSWFDGLTAHSEVFTDPDACLARIADVLGAKSGQAAARALFDVAASTCHVDPATDVDVAQFAAPGTPPTIPVGD